MGAGRGEVDVSRQPFDVDAAFAAWWPRVCEAGGEFLRRVVPRWGDARYLWDLVEPDDRGSGAAGWRGWLVSAAVLFVGAALAALVLRLVWLAGAVGDLTVPDGALVRY